MAWIWRLVVSAVLLVLPAAVAGAQDEGQAPSAQEASDFVIGLNALNNQVIQALDQAPTRRVIVLPFADFDGNYTRVSNYLREQLVTALVATRKYQIAENRELLEIARSGGIPPLELGMSEAYRRVAPKLDNVSVIVGAMTDLQTRFAVQVRILTGKTGEYSGGAMVYIRVGDEIASLLDDDRAQYRPDLQARAAQRREEQARPVQPETRPTENKPVPQNRQAAERTQPAAKPLTEELEPQQGLPDIGGQSDLAVYRMGQDHLKRRRYTEAMGYFRALVERYPDSPLADNAIYWTGECYYSQKNWQKALDTFQSVLDLYPYADKVPAATLKRGFALEELGRTGDAIASMEEVIKRFTDSPEARIARDRLQILRAAQQR